MNQLSEMSVEDILAQFEENKGNPPVETTPASTATPATPAPTNPLNIATTLEDLSNKSVDDILEESTEDPEKKEPETPEVAANQVQKGRPKDKLDPLELSSIQLLIDNGKLQPWVNEKNEVILPTTRQELLELMDENLDTINENSYQAVANQFYETKSPVWQQLLKYSETAKSLDEVAPLFSAMQEMETFQNLNIDDVNHQEYIVKQYGLLNGLDEETIDNDIVDLKERGKLQDRATKLKPGLDRWNEQKVQQELIKKQQEEQKKQYLLQNHYNNVVENVMNKKEISGVKMKDEHRQYIASTLVPDENLGGLPIYTIIDNLLQQGDFDTLARIALLGSNPKIHDHYFNTKNSNEVAANLQRTLRTAHTPATNSVANDEYQNNSNNKRVDWIEKSKRYL